MANFTDHFENLTARPGLYRVWVPLRNDGRGPLISIWIDPAMTAFESQPREESIGPSEIGEAAMAEEEDPKRRGTVAPSKRQLLAKTIQ